MSGNGRLCIKWLFFNKCIEKKIFFIFNSFLKMPVFHYCKEKYVFNNVITFIGLEGKETPKSVSVRNNLGFRGLVLNAGKLRYTTNVLLLCTHAN